MILAAMVAALLIGSHSGLLFFLATHSIDRHKAPLGVDWNHGSEFVSLLVIYIFIGFSSYVFQNYILWLLATFTNDPTVLSLFSGYVEALKALGVMSSFAIDSKHTPFLIEEISYFSLNVVGLVLCFVSAILYTRDKNYEEESSISVSSLSEQDRRDESISSGRNKRPVRITAEEKNQP